MRAVVKYHIVSYTVIKSLLLQLFLCIKLYVNKNLILPNNLCVSNLFITHTHTQICALIFLFAIQNPLFL